MFVKNHRYHIEVDCSSGQLKDTKFLHNIVKKKEIDALQTTMKSKGMKDTAPEPVCREFSMIFKFNLALVFPSKNLSTILRKNSA